MCSLIVMTLLGAMWYYGKLGWLKHFFVSFFRTLYSSCQSTESLCPDVSRLRENSIFNMFGMNDLGAISDKFSTLEDVSDAILKAGVENCNLIFGVDFTASNIHQGLKTNDGRSLHNIDPYNPNPYQRVICILGETLEKFDSSGRIPAYGFGDVTTKDTSVFPFTGDAFCGGFHGVLNTYNEIASNVHMSGPTSFVPLIDRAIEIVKFTRSYHILVIVADGQVTDEKATMRAIVEASRWPISIIMVGVGDGPWDVMKDFDDRIPARKFDNFQFVDFHKITSSARNPQAAFALQALMEIPDQYKLIRKLGLLNF